MSKRKIYNHKKLLNLNMIQTLQYNTAIFNASTNVFIHSYKYS